MTPRQPETVKPVYVLHGKDGHLKLENRNRLVSMITEDGDPQMCLRVFEGEVELIDVLDELRTLPFLAPHRVVVVREADGFVQKNREALEKYLENPAEKGTLILAVDSWNKNTKLSKKVDSVGQAIACSSPQGGELISWIKQEAAKYGKKIKPDAATALVGTIGNDLSSLRSELEKLCSYTGDSESISAEDVGSVVNGTIPPEAFELVNAIGAGNVKKAMELLHAALSTRGAEFMVLGQLAWHVRRQKPNQGRRSAKKLQSDMRNILQADIGMKSGLDPRDSLQLLVVRLCT